MNNDVSLLVGRNEEKNFIFNERFHAQFDCISQCCIFLNF